MNTNLPTRITETSTLVERLRRRANDQPHRTAYTFLLRGDQEEESITYAELDQRARTIAASLQEMKMTGKRALLLYPPGLEYIAAFFGCLYASVIAVPSYPPGSERLMPRLLAIVENAEAEVILASNSQLVAMQRWLEHVPALKRLPWITTDLLPSSLANDWREPAITGETIAFLQYTSGSTATPKGVILTYNNLLQNSHLMQYATGATPDDIGVFWLPPYHDMGLIGAILQPLNVGFPVILMPPVSFLQRPFRWLEQISRKHATVSSGPNFAFDLCVRKTTPEQRATLDLSSWRLVVCGAEPVRAETIESFTQAFAISGFKLEAFYPSYGLAECSLMAAGGPAGRHPVIRSFYSNELELHHAVSCPPETNFATTLVSCGHNLPNQRLAIVDPVTQVECPSDGIGEIWIKGESVAQGYWGKPVETRETFQAYLADTGDGPFLRTGDLGFFFKDDLFVTGRIKDMIIIFGRNHYPHDIELTVDSSHSAIRSGCSAAFSIDADGKEQLVIVSEIDPHFYPAHDSAPNVETSSFRKPLEAQDVISSIRQAVAAQHDLQVYQIVLVKAGEVPKTSSGKLQRRACRTQFLSESLGIWDE